MSRRQCKGAICFAKAEAAVVSISQAIASGAISDSAIDDLSDLADRFADTANSVAIAGALDPDDDRGRDRDDD